MGFTPDEVIYPKPMRKMANTCRRAPDLEYGAIDMRLTPEGESIFLEVNPAGQFLYVEMATGMKIAAASAEHLAQGKPASVV